MCTMRMHADIITSTDRRASLPAPLRSMPFSTCLSIFNGLAPSGRLGLSSWNASAATCYRPSRTESDHTSILTTMSNAGHKCKLCQRYTSYPRLRSHSSTTDTRTGRNYPLGSVCTQAVSKKIHSSKFIYMSSYEFAGEQSTALS